MEFRGDIKEYAVARAKDLGFALAGVAAAGPAEHAGAYEEWIAAGRHASMDYLAHNAGLRRDVRAVEPWAQSVLCLAASYASGAGVEQGSAVAAYARGRDYHKVLKRKCHALADELVRRWPGLKARACVDTAPLLERSYAWSAGLGWIGRNSCLVHPRLGSYLLLAEILLSEPLPADSPMADQCGACRACMEACPNGALVGPRVLDARRCISWATVEHRGEMPGASEDGSIDPLELDGQIFGCDRCQQACPFNGSTEAGMAELVEPLAIADVGAAEVVRWSREDWDLATRGSAARRATYEMFLRNACIVAGQQRLNGAVEGVKRLTMHPDAAVARASQWALERLRS